MATRIAPEPKLARKPESAQKTAEANTHSPDREVVFDIFRRWGFLQASLDPLGQYLPAEPFPTPAPDGEAATEARRFYCGNIGVEFMHIASPEKRAWIQEQMERPYTAADPKRILNGLIRADVFEQVIQQRYLGTKRFFTGGPHLSDSLPRPAFYHGRRRRSDAFGFCDESSRPAECDGQYR